MTLHQKLKEIAERAEKAIPGPYMIERVDFECDEITYEVSSPNTHPESEEESW